MDYENELYKPVRASALNQEYEIIFPHENEKGAISSKEIIRISDVVCAEVSYPATGVGIEIGWADSFEKPILCFYKKGSDVSGSLKFVAKQVIAYSDMQDFVTKLGESLKQL
jgi:hypothetical protein